MKAEYVLTVSDPQGHPLGSARSPSAEVIRRFGESLPANFHKLVDIFPPAPQEPHSLTWDQFLANERQASPKAQ